MSDRIQITKSISRTAGRWARFARAQLCRFDVERKAAASVAFCSAQASRSFAVPSKLTGTSQHQDDLALLRDEDRWIRLDLDLDEEPAPAKAGDTLCAYWHGCLVGHIQRKHHAWLLPLLATGRVDCYVLEVTGADAPTLGCNIVFTGIEEALIAAESTRDCAYRILGKPVLAA